jgi:hypothetical protein
LDFAFHTPTDVLFEENFIPGVEDLYTSRAKKIRTARKYADYMPDLASALADSEISAPTITNYFESSGLN